MEATIELAGAEACLVMHRAAPPALNDALAELWRLEPEEREALARSAGLETRDVFAAILARRLRQPAAFLEAARRTDPFGQDSTRSEYPLADGRIIEGFGAPLRGAAGAVTSRFLFYRDITATWRDATELRERAVRETAVARLGRIAVAAEALAPLSEAAVAMVAETLAVPVTALLELEPDVDRLVVRSAIGVPARAIGAPLATPARARHGLELLATGPVVSCDEAGPFGGTALAGADIAWSASVLIRGKDRPYGVLAAYARDPRPFGRDELGFLEAIASVLGSAIARQQAERETADREALLRAVFEGAQDAIHICDSEGRILDANPAAAALFGLSRAELVGRGLRSFLRPGRDRQAASDWERFLAAGRQEGELEIFTDGRTPRSVEYTAVANILPGRHLTVMRDVTERRQLSARIALSDKMISVGTMAAGVAHELNNPLAYVAANLSYVGDGLRQLAAGAPSVDAAGGGAAPLDEMARAVREARDGAERMRIIIRDLLALSRSDESTRGPVDVAAVLESCMQMARNEIRHRAALVKEIEPTPRVMGNAARLSQVFLNLLVNAAQAIPEGAAARHRIRVAARPTREGRVLVEVQDSGAGIAAQDLPRIFDPFFTTKPLGVGTGLGLSISHNIVTSYGGEIEVESEPGKGSTFRVLLAAAPVARAAPPAAPRPAVRAPRSRLLVVDDEPLVGVSLRRALSSEHDVVVTSSAADALALVRRGDAFDLVLSDLLMPDMTGMELFASLEKDAPRLARHMVFLTGGAFTPAARDFLDAHRDRCVEKPFEVAALRDVVRRRLAESRAPDA
jgi:PAS domain S-box-containing protein